MDCFWPQTLMDFATIIAAAGTLFAMFLSLHVIYAQFKILKIQLVKITELIIYSQNRKQKKRYFKLELKMQSLITSEIELVAVAVETVDSNGMYLVGNIWNGNQLLRPRFNNRIVVDIDEPKYSSNYFPKKGFIYLVSKDNSAFKIKASRTFLRAYSNYMNNQDIEGCIETEEMPGGLRGIGSKLRPPLWVRLYKIKCNIIKYIRKPNINNRRQEIF